MADESKIHVAHRGLDDARNPAREELLNRLRTYRDRLPADFKFDRDEANAREPCGLVLDEDLRRVNPLREGRASPS